MIHKDFWVLRHLDTWLAVVFGPYTDDWFLDYKLYLGFGMWGYVWGIWLIKGYSGLYTLKAPYAFGLNLVILHLLQYLGRWGITLALCILVAQSSLTVKIWWRTCDVLKQGSFSAHSVYQNLSCGMLQVTFLFASQLMLFIFFFSWLFNNFDVGKISYLFWVTAYLVMQMSCFFNRGADSMLGSVWPTAEWHDICIKGDTVLFSCKDRFGVDMQPFSVGRFQLLVRQVMGFMVNIILRDIFAFTVPILVMQFRDPLNFVVYCVGVNWIVTLDNIVKSKAEFKVTAREQMPVTERSDKSRSMLFTANDEEAQLKGSSPRPWPNFPQPIRMANSACDTRAVGVVELRQ